MNIPGSHSGVFLIYILAGLVRNDLPMAIDPYWAFDIPHRARFGLVPLKYALRWFLWLWWPIEVGDRKVFKRYLLCDLGFHGFLSLGYHGKRYKNHSGVAISRSVFAPRCIEQPGSNRKSALIMFHECVIDININVCAFLLCLLICILLCI